MRKLVLLAALAAVLAIFVVPVTSADAKASDGSYASCYTIKKKGNYNDVGAGVLVSSKGTGVRVTGIIEVSKNCQRPNSIPIHRITILHTRLRDAMNGKVVRLSGGKSTTTGSLLRTYTGYQPAACGHRYQASVEIGYAYNDGSYVRPFWIHGRIFARC